METELLDPEIGPNEEPPLTSFGLPERFRQRRKTLGLTLRQVADLLETTPQTIQRLETGNMSLNAEWIDKLAHALSMTAIELFTPEQMFIEAKRRAREDIVRELRRLADDLEKGYLR